jgi:hypothetical protein
MKEVGVDKNGRPKLEPSGEEVVFECDDVLMAIGPGEQLPLGSSAASASSSTNGTCPRSTRKR